MKSAIRLDDITMNMDWDRFIRVKKILDEAGISPLIGVVPCSRDENLDHMKDAVNWPEEVRQSIPADKKAFAEYIRGLRSKGWVVAVHGYDHVYRTKKAGLFPLNRQSEFAGCDYEDQLDRLRLAMDEMYSMDIDTDIFMAPSHSYDMNTLKALYEVGIRCLTDGFGNVPYRRYIRIGGLKRPLDFYPIAIKRNDCISDKYGYTTMVLHTNTMTDNDISGLREMIGSGRDHFIDYSEYIKMHVRERSPVGHVAEYMTAMAKMCMVRIRSLRG